MYVCTAFLITITGMETKVKGSYLFIFQDDAILLFHDKGQYRIPYLPMDAIFSIGYVLLLLSFYIPLFILGLKWILKRNLFSAKNNRELPFSKKALGLSLKILLILIYAVPSLEWIFLSALFFSLGFFSIFPMEYYQNWGWFLHSCLMN